MHFSIYSHQIASNTFKTHPAPLSAGAPPQSVATLQLPKLGPMLLSFLFVIQIGLRQSDVVTYNTHE